MGKTKENIGFSVKFLEEEKAVEAALKKVSKKLIEETKKENGYLVVADRNGIVTKIPAKDL